MSDIRFNGWLHRSGTGGVYQDSSGRVGIGTSTQNHSLVLYQADSGTHDCISMRNSTTVNNGFTMGVSSAEDAFIWNGSNTNMTFATNNSEKLRITSAGRVGINETSPDRDLHISNTTPYIRVESTSANQPATLELYHTRGTGSDKGPVSVATDDAALTFNVSSSVNGTPAEKLRITSDGKLLVGKNSVYGSAIAQVHNTSQYVLDLNLWSADANAAVLAFYKSRNATPGGATIVQDDDGIGS